MYEQTGDIENAFLIYSKLRVSHPDNAWIKVRYEYIKSTQTEFYLKEAEKFKNQYNMEAYIRSLKNASRYSPEITDIQVEIGDHYNFQEQFPEAAVLYEKVLEKLPNNDELLLKLAAVYEKMQKFDSAVMIYQKMLETKPGDLSILNKINELKIKFYDVNLPVKFKNIFFKEDINREELAALIGHYFEKYLEPRPPVIVTDISGSFAKEQIIRVCTLNIMQLRPDHSFSRFDKINRASFAVIFYALIQYLEQSGTGVYDIRFTPVEQSVEPADISPLHKHYTLIKFLVNAQIVELDEENNFKPTELMTPPKVLKAIKKILNSIKEK
jgi:tetratricopeptide (TPR) repeat protein